jgi:hypothetical protein
MTSLRYNYKSQNQIYNSQPNKPNKPNNLNVEFNIKNIVDKKEQSPEPNSVYLNAIQDFYKMYNVREINDQKTEYRYFCFRYLNYIRKLKLCAIQLGQPKEAVLIEFRKFPHLEFLLRNTIHKLNSEWSHTIICGNLNYDFIVNICESISPNIKIIKLDIDNMTQYEYSMYLTTIEFWGLLVGEKILLYQEDTCIFKHNINDFLQWDYIGAPWNKTQNDTHSGVGNGGFSLRTKQCMIDVINKISVEDTVFNSSTMRYMVNSNLKNGPEDVYFSLNMQNFGIGKVADWDSARNFSSESIPNHDSLGGHCFWLLDYKWKDRLYKDVVIQFKPFYDLNMTEHRGGWKLVIEELIRNDFFNINSANYFFDMVEKQFLWSKTYLCNNKWAGIIHCTQKTPEYLNIVNISYLFTNENFIKSLANCLYIVSLTNYVSEFLKNKFDSLNINVNVITIPHPIENDNIPLFNIHKFIANPSKTIIQIGQQLRKITSIYTLKTNKPYKKMWLTGTKNFNKCNQLMNLEVNYYNVQKFNMNDVNMKYTESFDEYDNYLTNNIVFLDLFDAAANNAVLECIVRRTPIVINKIPGVVEYLGEDYPLYFENLEDVNELLSYEKIFNAHIYLKGIKTINMAEFGKRLINI